MDDDVKNLFQKFGQPATAYQEISREVESEQAKKRWPLLRDVRVQAMPDYSMSEGAESSPTPQVIPSIRSEVMNGIDRKPVLKENTGGNFQDANDLFAKKKAIVPPAPVFTATAKSNGAAGIFRSERPHKAASFHPEDPKQDDSSSSVFRSSPADIVSLPDDGAGYQETAVVLPVHTDKNQSVADVFKRLAKQPEPVKTVDAPVNSFFKKIFKS